MRLALDEARQAAREDEVPVGAVLVAADGRLLARAHNRPVALHDPTAHAEILALRAAGAASRSYCRSRSSRLRVCFIGVPSFGGLISY